MCSNICSELLQINPYCLIDIISYLNFKEQLQLAHTSHYLYQIYVSFCKSSFQGIDLQDIDWLLRNEASYKLEPIICHVRKFTLVCKLHESVEIPRVVDFLLTIPNLTELKLSCGFNIDDENFNKICSMTNLKSLSIIQGAFKGRDLYKLKNLSVLHLCNCLQIDVGFVFVFLDFAIGVKVLKLIKCHIREGRIKLRASCFHLEELHVDLLHINLKYHTILCLPKLKKLSFEFCYLQALLDFSKIPKAFFKSNESEFLSICDTEFRYQDFISYIENLDNLLLLIEQNAIEIPQEEILDLDQLRNSNNMSIWFQWMDDGFQKLFIIALRKD